MKLRPAIAMIELIFAIVIMGIVLMSVPNLIRTTEKSGYVTIQQEAINEVSTHLNVVLSYHWDENDTYDTDDTDENDTNKSYPSPILRVTNGDPGLDEALLPDGRTMSTSPKLSFELSISL
jgi:type II secretory pathway pseudopilin PulG